MAHHWYLSAFGADYLERYAHRDDEEAARVVGGVMARVAMADGGRALDLCCGGGRHLAALHAAGWRAVGLDLSWDLLAAARAELGADDSPLVRGDMRALPFAAASFDLVAQFFTAFGYFDDDAENLAVFEGVARVLAPGGVYVFDFLSAPHVHAQLGGHGHHVVESFDDGPRVETHRRISPDGRRVEKHMVRVDPDGTTTERFESVRLFEPPTLRAALAGAGFSVEHEWGSYDFAPYAGAASSRWMIAARRLQSPRAHP